LLTRKANKMEVARWGTYSGGSSKRLIRCLGVD
jgi:hypothetical protein